ncbi:MAG: hypothetical protein WCX88_03705 [Patescibacteria group bacterium]
MDEIIKKLAELFEIRASVENEIREILERNSDVAKFNINSVSKNGKKVTGNFVKETEPSPLFSGDPLYPSDDRQKGHSKSKHKWCREYDGCVVCGSSKLKHISAGVCAGCYSPLKVKAIKAGVDPKKLLGATSKKMRELMGEDTSKPRDYYCNDCEHEFKSDKAIIDVVCPNCKSIHVGLAH